MKSWLAGCRLIGLNLLNVGAREPVLHTVSADYYVNLV